ncbi:MULTISPECIES: hypothetical protein [unclassified Oceanobacillus]
MKKLLEMLTFDEKWKKEEYRVLSKYVPLLIQRFNDIKQEFVMFPGDF